MNFFWLNLVAVCSAFLVADFVSILLLALDSLLCISASSFLYNLVSECNLVGKLLPDTVHI